MSLSTHSSKDFIREIIDEDLAAEKHDSPVTRFPPEPNGYLHLGHAKSICLNFGIAQEYGGRCHLRFDDTNPTKEEVEYVDSIKEDIKWLGFNWGEHLYFASDYFEKLYEWALALIKNGKAYVDEQSAAEIRSNRGDLQNAGIESPFRDRPSEESLDLFQRMKAGEFPDGHMVLRAKVDMAHANLNMRDPVLYRILHAEHHRTGDKWCIYPMYDYTHGQSDALEYVTHSLCTLEFENHRLLYDWFLENLPVPSRPRQIEFSRLNLNYTVMSKRKLLQLVNEGYVKGWDDPRMPTLSGIRRRGYPPTAIRNFCKTIGITKFESTNDYALLENAVREVLNQEASRFMAVLDPIRVVVTNYPEDQVEMLEANNHPENPAAGVREIPFSREIFIERDDFMEDPPKKFFRLSPGAEVRLRAAYFLRCEEVIKDAAGNIVELRCTYDPATRSGGNPPDGRKVKATIHWVCALHAVSAEVRVYDRLFASESPDRGEGSFLDHLNPDSLTVVESAKLEPGLASLEPGTTVQWERLGYFCVDPDSTTENPVFNRTVGLRDSWAKAQGQG
ncbi:MAG: glutamine--tRNA ligase/YqeY domain fusion protein [Verrucomicrobiales bacterium]|nr:glutamine--tRNA ligase/YqeY domain fusion protein [Verrucomicrobiales bacterium]MBP9222795.1 glutamine--tRNA ligase/YqeY domain fusion protein [Verrucomicrobiales bacterium]